MNKIIEIDGPPIAYFEFSENRVIYKTLAITGNNPNDLVQHGENQLEIIRAELNKLKEPILYWRRRPVLVQVFDSNSFPIDGLFKWTCRLQTYPELSEFLWSKLCVKELGEESKTLKKEAENESGEE